MSRYPALFDRLGPKDGAFVPFVMLGDPTPEASLRIVDALVAGGADALELGIPFSDPVADGPTIQKSHIRALAAGTTVDRALELIAAIRARHPEVPIGLLVYGNVPFARGINEFYTQCANAGADSILIPDLPVREGAEFCAAANLAGIDQIFIAPPHASRATLEGVARHSQGYIYAVSRVGVTGAEQASSTEGLREVVEHINSFGGAPALLGFGISTPAHVRAAIDAGARGAICGSAITKLVEQHLDGNFDQLLSELKSFASSMKAGANSARAL